jgi:hypothetical protein
MNTNGQNQNPKLTSAQKQKNYRDKQIAKYGAAEFKKMESQKRALRRAAKRMEDRESMSDEEQEADMNKRTTKQRVAELTSKVQNSLLLDATPPVGDPDSLPEVMNVIQTEKTVQKQQMVSTQNCENLAERLLPELLKIKKTSLKTVKKNLRSIGIVYERIFNTPKMSYNCDSNGFEFLRDTKTVLAKLKEIHPIPRTDDKISAICSTIRVLKGFEKEYKIYSEWLTVVKTAQDDFQNSNVMSESQKKEWLSWDKILAGRKKIVDEGNKRDLCLFDLYTYIPRRLDYSKHMVLVVGGSLGAAQKMSKDANYMLVDAKTFEPKNIIINKYKTSAVYKQQLQKDFPEKLKKSASDYIRSKQFQTGSYLFGKEKGNEPVKTFKLLGNVFKKYFKKNISVNVLRHSYISFLSEDKNLTSAQVLKYATSLGHSPERFYQYRKFDVVSQKGSGGMKRMQKRKMKEVELYKPFKSKAKNKLHSVCVKNEHTGKPKIIHFGDSRYNQNTSAKARKAYLRRSAGIRDKTGQLTKDNKNSANYWSRTYLWNAD